MMTLSTYSPALSRPSNPAQDIAIDAMQRWPFAPAAALRSHLSALREVFARCPETSRRSNWGERHETHMSHIERAIALLDKKEGG